MTKINLNSMTTESVNERSLNIDKVETIDIVRIMNEEDKLVPIAIEKELSNIAKAINIIVDRIRKGGRLFYIGAGTSGRLGVLDASECPPTYGVESTLVQGIMAGGEDAVFRAKEGAEDSKEQGKIDLENCNLNENDVVVGLAASGRTPYVIGALEYVNEIGAYSIAVSCNKPSEIGKVAKIDISPVVGAEVVTGSTRLKSGTAQKLVLNMLSTGAMIKLGKVFGNLMIDVKATNEKLVERAKVIIEKCTGCSREIAEEYFEKSDRNVKLAIFMIKSKLEKDECIKLLSDNEGIIAKALDSLG